VIYFQILDSECNSRIFKFTFGQVYVHLYTGGVYSHEMAIATGGSTLTLKLNVQKIKKKNVNATDAIATSC